MRKSVLPTCSRNHARIFFISARVLCRVLVCGHLLVSAQYALRGFITPGQLEKCCVLLEGNAPYVVVDLLPASRAVGPTTMARRVNLPDQALFWIKIAATPIVDLNELGSSEVQFELKHWGCHRFVDVVLIRDGGKADYVQPRRLPYGCILPPHHCCHRHKKYNFRMHNQFRATTAPMKMAWPPCLAGPRVDRSYHHCPIITANVAFCPYFS